MEVLTGASAEPATAGLSGAEATTARNIRLTVAYDGGAFHGFQLQPGHRGRTIQGVLETRLREITCEPLRILAAGRTDAGVHALGQVVNFKTSAQIPLKAWVPAMNAGLPRDVRVVAAEEVPLQFHARYDAKGKTYRYLVFNGRVAPVLWRNFAYFVPAPLDLEKMRAGAAQLVGRYDFSSFRAAGSDVKTSTRTITRFDWTEHQLAAGDLVPGGREPDEPVGPGAGRLLVGTVSADGFLYNMVRIMIGLLVEVGKGRRPVEDVARVRDACDRTQAGITAPPHGLCLVEVKY